MGDTFFTEGHGTLEIDGEHERRPDHGDTSWTDHDDVQSALLLSGRHLFAMCSAASEYGL